MRNRFLAAISFLVVFGALAAAAVPSGNRMQLGTVSSILPAPQMRAYYALMEPVMREYFGPPFSDFTMNVEAKAGDARSTEIDPKAGTLVMGPLADQWIRNKVIDLPHALGNVYGQMEHELSHSMYIFKGTGANLGSKWNYEGWANVMQELLENRLQNATRSPQVCYEYYLDKDTVSGTPGDASKQASSHSIQYGMATCAHLLLLSSGSASNDNLDFYKRLNAQIYDKLASKGTSEPAITFDEYKAMVKSLLGGAQIDGQDAFDWYFGSPAFFSAGTSGPHLGVIMKNREDDLRPMEIVAFMFDRQTKSNSGHDQVVETPLANAAVSITVTDSDGKTVLARDVATGSDGDASIRLEDLPAFKDGSVAGALYLSATATANGRTLESGLFAFHPPFVPVKKEYLYGVLLGTDGRPLAGNLVSLLKADAGRFLYRKNGLFILEVPADKRSVTLDFLGHAQSVTKGPFARVYALKVPQESVSLAAQKSAPELEAGLLDDTAALVSATSDGNNRPLPNGSATPSPAFDNRAPINEKPKVCGDGLCEDFERSGPNPCTSDCGPVATVQAPRAPPSPPGPPASPTQPFQGGPQPKPAGFLEQFLSWLSSIFAGK